MFKRTNTVAKASYKLIIGLPTNTLFVALFTFELYIFTASLTIYTKNWLKQKLT